MKNNVKIVILNGPPGSGKDTFVELTKQLAGELSKLLKYTVTVANISSIDPIKNIAKEMGWDGVKTPETRNMLSELKDISVKYFDYPFKYICNKIESFDPCGGFGSFLGVRSGIIFIHVREVSEIIKLKNKYPAAYTLYIDSDRKIEDDITNKSDNHTSEYKYMYYVTNVFSTDNSMNKYKLSVKNFMKKLYHNEITKAIGDFVDNTYKDLSEEDRNKLKHTMYNGDVNEE